MSYRHYVFLQERIVDLNRSLEAIGQKLIVKIGNAVNVLHNITERYNVETLWSHQETWKARLTSYLMPIEDKKIARKTATDKIYALRQTIQQKKKSLKKLLPDMVVVNLTSLNGEQKKPQKNIQRELSP